jgi:hypothetical protein
LARAGNEPPRPGDEIDEETRRAVRSHKPTLRSPKRSVRPSAKRTAEYRGEAGDSRKENLSQFVYYPITIMPIIETSPTDACDASGRRRTYVHTRYAVWPYPTARSATTNLSPVAQAALRMRAVAASSAHAQTLAWPQLRQNLGSYCSAFPAATEYSVHTAHLQE